jgi:hypothetical protein
LVNNKNYKDLKQVYDTKNKKVSTARNINVSWKLEKRTTRMEVKEYLDAYCGGSRFHNNISTDGKLQMIKEQYHADYVIDKPDD